MSACSKSRRLLQITGLAWAGRASEAIARRRNVDRSRIGAHRRHDGVIVAQSERRPAKKMLGPHNP